MTKDLFAFPTWQYCQKVELSNPAYSDFTTNKFQLSAFVLI